MSPEIANRGFAGLLAVVTGQTITNPHGDEAPVAAVYSPNSEHHFIAFEDSDVEFIGTASWTLEAEWLPVGRRQV